jgi:NodT family efflux transporter outer membrane factor (OMF) lipoprotein
LPGRNFSTFSTGFDASWEIDLFGGAKRSRQAAKADLDASIWTRRDAQVTLSAEVARAYFSLRLIQAQLAQADALVAARKSAVDQAAAKARSGILSGQTLTGPTALLKQAEAERAQREGDKDGELAALAVLLAVPVSDLPPSLIASRPNDGVASLDIPPGLPSDLLRRRPDIREAERHLAAATARIGVAKADLYPRITLTGVAELISTALGNLVTSGSIQTLAEGQLSFPLVDFGRGKAKVGVATEQAQQAYLAYRKTVLGALADVERALGAVQAQRARNLALRASLQQAETAQSAAQAAFQAGLTDSTPVDQAKEHSISARLAALDGDFALKQAEIALFKALGGGWPAETAHNASGASSRSR